MPAKLPVMPILLMSIINNKAQEVATKECYMSITSDDAILDVTIDSKSYKYAIADKLNNYFKRMLKSQHEYFLVLANDTVLAPNAVDIMIQSLKDNNDYGVITMQQTSVLEDVVYESNYEPKLLKPRYTSNFIIKTDVIRNIGFADYLYFPHEFVDHDLFYRAQNAGFKVGMTGSAVCYHPEAGNLTIEGRTSVHEKEKLFNNKHNIKFTMDIYEN